MNSQYEIYERVFKFVIRGLKVVKYLPKTTESKIILEQYIRSLTSVGANINEADGATSKRDSIHCFTIVRKELKETYYWLRIITELFINLKPRLQDLLKENEELIKIISMIIIKLSK